MPSSVSRRDSLLSSAQSFCDSFANQKPLNDVLNHFSSSSPQDILCYEHGLSQLAPFLGREFRGKQGAKDYFTLIGSLLSYNQMSFSDYVVDADASIVCVRGKACFTWKSTGSKWDEVFTYRLLFDDDAKVLKYEVWADSGAAYLASRGEIPQE